MSYVTSREACNLLGVHANTLRRLEAKGKIETIRVSGQRRYNVQLFIENNKVKTKHKICYCRVSSKKQIKDLNRQIKLLSKKYPKHEIIKDIGSGINYKRSGLQKILEYAMSGELEQVVVTYKDRLARFGFSFIKKVIELANAELVVHFKQEISKEEELVEDLIRIVTVYSASLHGSRRYKIVEDKNISKDNRTQDKKSNKNNRSKSDTKRLVRHKSALF